MDFSEKWGQDIDEATQLALKDLKTTIDEVEVIILEEPSKGFLGLGSRLAKVRVERKKVRAEDKKLPKEPEKREPKTRDREEKTESKKQSPVSVSSIATSRPADLKAVDEHAALDFLRQISEKMGLALQIRASENEECIYLDIEGKDAGTIIGKRGQTLDAIQYLTSLVVNKEKEKYIRVVVDAENYRGKREKTLEQLAERLASKVIKTRRSVRLEPMNPYERMVIHATLHSDPKVKTRSEGEEPYRRVIIELK